MGLGTPDKLHVCDGCDSTVTCTDSELTGHWKWKRHVGTGFSLLLCDDCEAKVKPKPTKIVPTQK